VAHYFRKHFYLTTSGNFDTAALVNAISVMGVDRVMFSVDWPFENVREGSQWIDSAEISEADRIKVGRANAIKLFRLPLR
jgi:2,3-dihydroxybenzoate decarboxylase